MRDRNPFKKFFNPSDIGTGNLYKSGSKNLKTGNIRRLHQGFTGAIEKMKWAGFRQRQNALNLSDADLKYLKEKIEPHLKKLSPRATGLTRKRIKQINREIYNDWKKGKGLEGRKQLSRADRKDFKKIIASFSRLRENEAPDTHIDKTDNEVTTPKNYSARNNEISAVQDIHLESHTDRLKTYDDDNQNNERTANSSRENPKREPSFSPNLANPKKESKDPPAMDIG